MDGGTWNLPEGTVFSWQYAVEDRSNSTLFKIKLKLEALSPNAQSFGVKGVGVAVYIDQVLNNNLDDDAMLAAADQWVASYDVLKVMQSSFLAGAVLMSLSAGILPDLGTVLKIGSPTGTAWRTSTNGDSKTYTINLDVSDFDYGIPVDDNWETDRKFWAASDFCPAEVIVVLWVNVFEDISFAPDHHITVWVEICAPYEGS